MAILQIISGSLVSRHFEITSRYLQGKTKVYKEIYVFVKIESWLLLTDLFDMFTQTIKFYKFHFKHGDSPNIQK